MFHVHVHQMSIWTSQSYVFVSENPLLSLFTWFAVAVTRIHFFQWNNRQIPVLFSCVVFSRFPIVVWLKWCQLSKVIYIKWVGCYSKRKPELKIFVYKLVRKTAKWLIAIYRLRQTMYLKTNRLMKFTRLANPAEWFDVLLLNISFFVCSDYSSSSLQDRKGKVDFKSSISDFKKDISKLDR